MADTICAPATSPFNSALAIIRISGTEALSTVSNLFTQSDKITHRAVQYGTLREETKDIDDVLLSYFKAPASFTGEDVVEISCHGNPLIVQRILQALTRFEGVRLAEPGEFSRRAFLNGKVDLTESEAINNIIQAKSEWEIDAALEQMHGSLKKEIHRLKDHLILLKANIEAAIDFSHEEIEFVSYDEALDQLQSIEESISSVLKRCKTGNRAAQGIDIAIVGKPNAGKSSILNMIINSERAIVSDIPGTTRDIIKESVQINGVHINLIDTAGIRQSDDLVENIGIEKSKSAIESAEIVIAVFDKTTGLTNEDYAIIDMLKEVTLIPLINKDDLAAQGSFEVNQHFSEAIPFSAVTGEGFQALEKRIGSLVSKGLGDYKGAFLADARVLQLLESAALCCESVNNALSNREPEEIVAYDIDELIRTLQEITGEVSADDVLHSIFSRFCIGK